MKYEIELIKEEQLQTNLWSGGTTTQLAIYPKDATYSQRNFKWRLSSAKVEAEESIFTSLPGINRIIMISEGEMTLEHKNHYKKLLKRFDQDSFSGSWTTKSYGKVVDFNLMMSEGCDGELEDIHLGKDETKIITFHNKKGFSQYTEAIYCVSGGISIEVKPEEIFVMHIGDIFLIKAEDNNLNLNFKICNIGYNQADLVRASIFY